MITGFLIPCIMARSCNFSVYVEHAIRKVKTWRIMGDRYRNPLKKYDRINDVICGLVNHLC